MLPLGNLAKAGTEAGGTILLKVGDEVLGALPVKLIQRVKQLPKAEFNELEKRLLVAKTREHAIAVIERFVGVMDRHHPLPKFLGGDAEQVLVHVPRTAHQAYHVELGKELKAAGLPLPVGTPKGSADAWAEYFAKHPKSQAKAFGAVRKAAATIDKLYRTKITSAVIDSIIGESFVAFK